MEGQIKQIDNIEEFNTLFEPINSPEYNQYCKEVGLAISYIGGIYDMWIELNDRRVTQVFNPLFDGERAKPYRISSLDGTYKDPRVIQEQFWKDSHPHLIDENPKFHIGFDPYKKEDGTMTDISIYKKDENNNMIPVGIKKQRTKLTLKDEQRDISGETKLSETKED